MQKHRTKINGKTKTKSKHLQKGFLDYAPQCKQTRIYALKPPLK